MKVISGPEDGGNAEAAAGGQGHHIENKEEGSENRKEHEQEEDQQIKGDMCCLSCKAPFCQQGRCRCLRFQSPQKAHQSQQRRKEQNAEHCDDGNLGNRAVRRGLDEPDVEKHADQQIGPNPRQKGKNVLFQIITSIPIIPLLVYMSSTAES